MTTLSRLLLLAALLVPRVAPAAPKAKAEVTWYGHAAFVVKSPKGLVLAIDPWLGNPSAKDKDALAKLERVDYILVTHAHGDHVGDAVAIAKKTGAKLVASFELSGALKAHAGFPPDQATMATAGNTGGTIALSDEVSVTLVPAVHSSGFQKDDATGPLAAGNPVGFVIRIANGPTLYHTGDTDVTGDMKLVGERFPVDVMLACIGGHFTMDPEGAALAATLVKAKAVVPMHFGTFPLLKGTPDELGRALKARGSKAAVVQMAVGETRSF